MKKESKILIKNIIGLFAEYKLKVFFVIVCIIFSSILNILNPIIDQKIIDEGLILKDMQVVLKYSLYNLIILAGIQFLSVLETKNRSYIKNLISFDLEKQAFIHTLKLKMDFFSNTNYAEIISDLRTDIKNISEVTNENTFYTLTSILRIFVGFIGLVLIDWKLSGSCQEVCRKNFSELHRIFLIISIFSII